MTTSARGWAVLLLNRLHYTSVVLSSFAFGLFLPFIRADLELSYLEIGALQGVWWAASAVFLVPFGVLLGRFNPNRRVLAGLALITPFVFAQGLAAGFWTLLAARLLTALTQAALAPARPLLLRWWAAPAQYSSVTAAGLSLHSGGMAAVLTFSPLIIVALNSWRLAYFLQSGLLAGQLLLWAALTWKAPAPVPEPGGAGRASEGQPDGNGQSAPEQSPPEQSPPEQSPAPAIKALVSYPQAWLLGGVMMCLSASWTTALTFLPTILEEERGVAISGGSILFGFLYYALIPGALAGSRIFRHCTNRRLMTLLPAALNTVFTVGALLSGNGVMAAAALTGIGLVWVFVPALEILPFEFRNSNGQKISAREVSALAALIQTFGAVGFGGGPALAGAIAQATGSLPVGALSVGGLTGLGIVAAARFPKNPGQTENGGR